MGGPEQDLGQPEASLLTREGDLRVISVWPNIWKKHNNNNGVEDLLCTRHWPQPCAWGDSVNPCDGPQAGAVLLDHLVLCSHTHLFTGGEIEAQKLQINYLVVSLPCSLWAQRPGHFLLFSRLEERYFSGVFQQQSLYPLWGRLTALSEEWLKAWVLEPAWVQIPLLPFTSPVTSLWASGLLICKMGE